MKKRLTAAELLAQLNKDPDYLARKAQQEAARQKINAELRQAEAPLLEALRVVGVNVQTAWDLVNTSKPYPEALPILLDHLQRPYPDRVREGIARALAVPDAIAGWNTLLHLFETDASTRSGAKWGIGCALSAAATDAVIEDVVRLLEEQKHGSDRLALIPAVARSKDSKARKVLNELRDDPVLGREIQRALKRYARKMPDSSRQGTPTKKLPSGFSEASMNFDGALVAPFLERLSALVDGFGPVQITEVVGAADELDVDEEHELDFRVKYEGEFITMKIRIFKDDLDAPDLYFFAHRGLTAEIEKLMEKFCDERGI